MLIQYGATYDRSMANTGDKVRTGYSKEAMKSFDCVEFVNRAMAADGITQGVNNKVRGSFMSFVNDESKFSHSTTAQSGDIAVWYGKDKDGNESFHTGIVTSVDKDGKFKLAHAAGTKSGIRENGWHINADQYRSDIAFQGFYRPTNETADGKNVSITSDTQTNSGGDNDQKETVNANGSESNTQGSEVTIGPAPDPKLSQRLQENRIPFVKMLGDIAQGLGW